MWIFLGVEEEVTAEKPARSLHIMHACSILLVFLVHTVKVHVCCRRIEAALSSKSSHSSSSTPSKCSQSNSSSFPATDQSAVQEDGEGFRWSTTGDHTPTGSSSKAEHISLGEDQE